MLKLNNVDVWFGKNHVLRNLSCAVEPGDFIVIVGANGQGKSTFFDTIAGKVMPTSGSISIDDVDVTNLDERQRAGMITRIFQNTQLNSAGSLTVHENLAMAHYSRRSARLVNGINAMPRERAEYLITSIGMDIEILDKPMNALSGGQRQLIAFVMATQMIPQVLLLDEPTAALDPHSSTLLLQYASQFIRRHKVTTLLITHDPHIALSIGNKVWILEDGKIAKQFNQDEKKTLNPDKLIGQIDYESLAG
jgi:putative ABC transport system ATP-binding protein